MLKTNRKFQKIKKVIFLHEINLASFAVPCADLPRGSEGGKGEVVGCCGLEGVVGCCGLEGVVGCCGIKWWWGVVGWKGSWGGVGLSGVVGCCGVKWSGRVLWDGVE